MSKKTQDVLGGFSSIFSIFFNFAKKTQDVLGGFLAIFSTFFNFKEDPGWFRRFFVNF
jgi:hypothetical protein